MTLLDVQHVKKIYKTRFKGNQVEALKDIHFTVEKGEYVAIMVSPAQENQPYLTSLPCLINQQAGASILMVWTQQPSKTRMLPVSAVKIGVCFPGFQSFDTLSAKDNILLPLVLFSTPT